MDREPLVPRVFETHISTVVLVGDRALKFPKPIANEFLDQSTPEKRREICERELWLNRRLAPDVYLGVGDVREGDDIVDSFLVMRRMPEHTRLSALVGSPHFDDAVRDVVRTVAAFHARQTPSSFAASVSTRDAVCELWQTKNLDQVQRFAGSLLDPALLHEVAELSQRYLAGREALFAERIALGYARDGHGDLLADDIFILPDGPRVLDCLAFDDSLRCGDVLLDIAFLAMDLERLAGRPIVDAVMHWYTEFSAEHHPRSLAHFCIAYRALVRAKVSCLQAEQGDASAGRRAAMYLRQCARHLRRAQPQLVLVGGAPGTGKTTVADMLADVDEVTVLSSDEIRKDLAGAERHLPLGSAAYEPAARARVYAALVHRARLLLERGESVVLDATWGSAMERTRAVAMAAEVHARVVALQCVLDVDTAAVRVEARRQTSGDASDATAEVTVALALAFEPWPDAATVDTGGSLEAVRTRLAVVVVGAESPATARRLVDD